MSTTKIRKTRKERQKAVCFEMDPPACNNCVHFKSAQYANVLISPRKMYMPAMCKLGNFQVRQNSICDEWTDKQGTRLESK